MVRQVWLAAALVVSIVPLASAGDEWSQFRGPRGSGVAPEGTRLPSVLDLEKSLEWSLEIEPGASSPCVSGDRIYITGCEGSELVTLCIDRRDGTVAWRRVVEVPSIETTNETHGPASPTPVTDGDHVVVYFGSFGLLCFDRDGEEVWRRPLPVPKNTFGTAASPIVSGGRVVFLSDANDSSYVEAIDLATGKTQWKKERQGFQSGWSTPVCWSRDEIEELLVYGVWWLTAYDARDGTERWSVPGLTDEPITTPIIGDDMVFVTSYNMKTNPEVIGMPTFDEILAQLDHDSNGKIDQKEAAENETVLSRPDADGEGDHPLRMFFRFLDVDRDGGITAEEWKKLVAWLDAMKHVNAVLAIRPGGAGVPAEIVWQFPRGVPECPSPIHYRSRVWMVMNGGMLTCLDAKSGELVFQGRLEARGPYYASLVAGDGKIYASSARGEVSVIEAVDRLQPLSTVDLGERLLATPALVDGALYVRTERRLLAFGTAD